MRTTPARPGGGRPIKVSYRSPEAVARTWSQFSLVALDGWGRRPGTASGRVVPARGPGRVARSSPRHAVPAATRGPRRAARSLHCGDPAAIEAGMALSSGSARRAAIGFSCSLAMDVGGSFRRRQSMRGPGSASAARSTPASRSNQGVRCRLPLHPDRYPRRALAGFPSGQRDQTVNLAAQPSQVRILPPPLHRAASPR